MRKIRLFVSLLLVSIVSLLISTNIVSANTIQYSGMIQELQMNSSFDLDDYPAIANDYSVNVIQVAETKENTLVIYVYQPAALKVQLDATVMNMTTNPDITHDYKVYNLSLVERVDVFAKYVVDDFVVDPTQEERYYSISAIYRAYDEILDSEKYEEQVNDDEWLYNHIYYTVAKSWCVTGSLMQQLSYQMQGFDVVEIEIDFVGSVRFTGGFQLGLRKIIENDCYAYFVAFRVPDYDVSKVFDADIRYFVRKKHKVVDASTDYTTAGDPTEIYKTIYENDDGAYEGKGLFARSYSWDRIQSVEKFKETAAENEITYTKALLDSIDDSEWVFMFDEYAVTTTTEIYYDNSLGSTIQLQRYIYDWTAVSEVSILRLHFFDKKTKQEYDLPAVSDIVTGNDIPDGTTPSIFDVDLEWLYELIEIIGKILLVIIVIAAVAGILYLLGGLSGLLNVLKVIWNVLLAILKVVFNIVLLPFKLISSLFKKDKKSNSKKKGDK